MFGFVGKLLRDIGWGVKEVFSAEDAATVTDPGLEAFQAELEDFGEVMKDAGVEVETGPAPKDQMVEVSCTEPEIGRAPEELEVEVCWVQFSADDRHQHLLRGVVSEMRDMFHCVTPWED